MRKIRILLLLFIVCILSGCSNNTANGKKQDEAIEYVYVPTFHGYNSGNIWISWINSTAVVDNKLVVVSTGWENRRASIVSAVDMNTGEKEAFDMKLDDSRYVSEIVKTESGYVVYSEDFMTEEEYTGYGSLPWKASYLTYYDESFNIVSEADITDWAGGVSGYSTLYYDCMTADNEGNVYFYVNGYIYIVDKNGSLVKEISPGNAYIQDMAYANGAVIALYEDPAGKIVAAPINVSEGRLGEPLENTPDCGYQAGIVAADGDSLYFFTDDNVYEYHFDTAEYEVLVAWMDCDIVGLGLYNYTVSGERLICTEQVESTLESVEYDLIILNKVNKAEVKEKTTLTVTMLRKDSWLMDFMTKFNRRSPDYRFEAVYYTEDTSPEAMEAAVNQFNMDLINGKVGDIIIVTSELDYYNLASKGTFASLDELIEQDTELDKEDFIENIIDTLRVEGKLYGIAPSFIISTLVGKTSNVGSDGSWNVSDVMNMLNEHEASQLLYGITKTNALKSFLMYSMDSYYDSVTGECSFNSDEFKKLLMITAQFPDTLEEYEFEADDYVNEVRLLESVYYMDMYMHQAYRAIFGEEVTFVGYPVDEGSGSVASFGNGLYAINAQSQYKEAAWQYIRQFLTEEYQSSVGALPVNKNVFENKLNEAVNADTSNQGWDYMGFKIKLEPVSEADVAAIRELVYGVTRSSFYDYEMMNIILEEAAVYYAGAKSVDEIADIIQSRIQVYVDERR